MAATIDAANDIDASATTGNTNLNVAASFSDRKQVAKGEEG